MYHVKRNCLRFNCLQRTSMQWSLALDFFSYHRAKEIFSAWFSDHGLLVKNDQQWKTFRKIYNMAILENKIFPGYQLWRHNILYPMQYLAFPAFWSHSVLSKIGQYTKNNLMIYNLSMFGKIIFCGDRKLWRHQYLGNVVFRKMW